MIAFLVSEFSKLTVSNLVKECFGNEFPDVFKKPQINYIFQYAKDLKAQTVLLEKDYLDKDYLEDYSRYYVKCFKNGGQRCARLHFFSSEISYSSFSDLLKNYKLKSLYNKEIQEAYLGFTVIKPLFQTFIGKTCLKTYSENRGDGKKRFFLHRTYPVNLFGIDLEVETTAFQEQDKVVSACATTAIWSALHGLQDVRIKQIPACSEITINAVNFTGGSTNGFPNQGLSNTQILRAIDKQGLKYHTVSLESVKAKELSSIIRYHIDSKIPLILGGEVFNNHGITIGAHAVTILGYLQNTNEIYIHDDRLGPFARCELSDIDKNINLITHERNDDGLYQETAEVFIAKSLIIPTDKKVRISYQLPLNTCKNILYIVKFYTEQFPVKIFNPSSLTYSIKLQNISEIRKHILEFEFTNGDNASLLEEKFNILTKSMARFQWVASFYFDNEPAFKILFDATDIPQGNAVTDIFTENLRLKTLIFKIIQKYSSGLEPGSQTYRQSFIPSLLRYINTTKDNYFSHLNKMYGELRAPQYLREEECRNKNYERFKYYTPSENRLDDIFSSVEPEEKLIWAISHDGALLLGRDFGHPKLTKLKPARIAGEIFKTEENWIINSKSGRYSKGYDNSEIYLKNAAQMFKTIFSLPEDSIKIINT
jgi:hypothetical protein